MGTQVKVLTVSDIHRRPKLYDALAKQVKAHSPDVLAVVGDFLNTAQDPEMLNIEECARLLYQLPCSEIVFVRGNHETPGPWWHFVTAWQQSSRELHLLERSCFTYGPLVIVGFPCLMLEQDLFAPDPTHCPGDWLAEILRSCLPAGRTLWLMHEPPSGTILSRSSGPLTGRREWREAIERFSPKLAICGHDHTTPMRNNRCHCRIDNQTLVINVGQNDDAPLNYVVIEMRFRHDSPSIPRLIRATGYVNSEMRRLQ